MNWKRAGWPRKPKPTVLLRNLGDLPRARIQIVVLLFPFSGGPLLLLCALLFTDFTIDRSLISPSPIRAIFVRILCHGYYILTNLDVLIFVFSPSRCALVVSYLYECVVSQFLEVVIKSAGAIAELLA